MGDVIRVQFQRQRRPSTHRGALAEVIPLRPPPPPPRPRRLTPPQKRVLWLLKQSPGGAVLRRADARIAERLTKCGFVWARIVEGDQRYGITMQGVDYLWALNHAT